MSKKQQMMGMYSNPVTELKPQSYLPEINVTNWFLRLKIIQCELPNREIYCSMIQFSIELRPCSSAIVMLIIKGRSKKDRNASPIELIMYIPFTYMQLEHNAVRQLLNGS